MLIWTRGALTILVCALTTAPSLAAERTFDRHFDAPPGGKLTLDTERGSVVIVGREARQVVVHAEINGSDNFLARMQISAVQASDGVTVTGRTGSLAWFDWLFDFDRNRVLFTIDVPRDYPVDIHTAGGRLDVRHVEATVHGTTAGGSITIRDVRGSVYAHTSGGHIDAAELHGPAELYTSGGHIEVADATGDLDVRTSGGGIQLEHIDGKVEARTSGGAIEAQLLGNRGITLITAGGSITLSLPTTVHGSLDAHTGGGRVSSTIPLTSTGIASSNELRGTINGGGEPIFLRTSGGGIYIGPPD